MSSLSAAELQRRHELEGAPDPFPSLTGEHRAVETKAPAAGPSASGNFDAGSEDAFPALAPVSSGKAPAASVNAWSSSPRVQSPSPASGRLSGVQTLTLPSIDLSQVSSKGKAPTLPDYQKTVGLKFRVNITSVQQRTSGQTTFTIKADSDKDIAKARKHLIATLSPTVTVKLDAPNSTLPSIIGPGGATIKAIRDKTNARIDVPRREEPSSSVNGHQQTEDKDKDEDEPSTTISISAPQPLALEARAMIEEIITAKRAKSTQRIRDVPAHILPFITPRRAEFLQAAEGVGEVNMTLDRPTSTITATGDRQAVKLVVENVTSTIASLTASLTPLKMPLPKKQHRLLTTAAVADIMAKTRCSVTVPAPEDPSDEISVWGNITQGTDVSSGLQAVIAKVNSQHTQEFIIPSGCSESATLYMNRSGYMKTFGAEHPKVTVYLPTKAQIASKGSLPIDLVGDKEAVVAAVESLSQMVTRLQDGTKEVEIDHLRHRLIQKKLGGKRLKQLQDSNNVLIFFPDDADELSKVILVADPSAVSQAQEASPRLDTVEQELLATAKECGDISSQTVEADQKWHESILGKDGTTLNAIIGDDRTLSIKLGDEAAKLCHSPDNNVILVRGTRSDVDRAVKEIHRIIESAKNDEIDNSYSTEFEINREFVGRIVGSGGSGINRIREQLGVKLDFVDDVEDKDKEQAKKKKASASASNQKSAVKISGRRENVEEAKRRIMNQVDRLADETSEVINIPHQYHSSLIGSSGKYVIRLEDKYSVKITFPREGGDGENRTRESLKKDEVLIKGGKKGVSEAKSELMEALDFEKESNNVLQFTVPTRAVPRILGKGGVNINEIKDTTDAQIDVDKGPNEQTQISLRGTKKAIAAAKAAILAISDQIGEEVNDTVTIESKHHRAIIGAGGQGLRDIIARCGGPSESRSQAGLVHFPRPGEAADTIQLRGERGLVKKLKAELEKAAVSLRDRVVIGVVIPAAHHKALIGRGGQHLTELQNRNDVQVQFPGSRAYGSVGEPENSSDVEGADPADVVKVMGAKAACEKAVEELKVKAKPSENRSTNAANVVSVVSVPLKYHHTIHQQGNFPRQLRSFGVQLEQSATPTRPTPAKPTVNTGARIDDDSSESANQSDVQWEVIENYQGAEEGEANWTLKARDQESLERAEKMLSEAIEHAKRSSQVGFLTLPNRKAFPRIVGSKGANVARLRAETGADITVSREDNTITLIGDLNAIGQAKAAILSIVSGFKDRERAE